MSTVGVIGLGAMGGGVAANLLKAKRTVRVCDVRRDRLDEFAGFGAVPVADPAEMARGCDIVMCFLPMAPFDPTLERILTGEKGVIKAMKRDSVVVECGNTSPLFTKLLAAGAKAHGVGFVDAPASGGADGAKQGTLSIMAGGSEEDFARALPVLREISSEVVHFGEAGMGQTAKLVNNMLVNGGLALLSEVMVFAEKCGLDLGKAMRSLAKGAAASWVLDNYGQGILRRPDRRHETPGGGFAGAKTGGRDKQLAWAIAMADDLETPLPVTAAAYQMFLMARGAGKGGLFEPIVAMLEDMTGVDLSSGAAE